MFAALGEIWSRIWFENRSATPIEVTRIGVGAALLTHYGLATPLLFIFWGDDGLMPRHLATENIDAWAHSIFFHFSAPWHWGLFHGLFLVSCIAFMIGWRT